MKEDSSVLCQKLSELTLWSPCASALRSDSKVSNVRVQSGLPAAGLAVGQKPLLSTQAQCVSSSAGTEGAATKPLLYHSCIVLAIQ